MHLIFTAPPSETDVQLAIHDDFAKHGFSGMVLVSLASTLGSYRKQIADVITRELGSNVRVVFARQAMDDNINTAILRFTVMPTTLEEVATAIKAVDWSKKSGPLAIGLEMLQPIDDNQRAHLWGMIVKEMKELRIGKPFVPPLYVGFGSGIFPDYGGMMSRGYYHCHFDLSSASSSSDGQ